MIASVRGVPGVAVQGNRARGMSLHVRSGDKRSRSQESDRSDRSASRSASPSVSRSRSASRQGSVSDGSVEPEYDVEITIEDKVHIQEDEVTDLVARVTLARSTLESLRIHNTRFTEPGVRMSHGQPMSIRYSLHVDPAKHKKKTGGRNKEWSCSTFVQF